MFANYVNLSERVHYAICGKSKSPNRGSNLVCLDAHTHTRTHTHTHTHFSEQSPVVFARLCSLRHQVCVSVCVCVCVCEGKRASELDGKGGSAGSNGGQRSGR